MSDTETRVLREPRTYAREATHSFFRDQLDSLALNDHAAHGRLEQHAREVSAEIQRGSEEGRRALREAVLELRRQDPERSTASLEREARAATSATIQGFTTPQWVVSEYAIARSTQRTFADQCKNLPLPDVGLTVHVPRFTANASAGVQSEGVAVTELDPTGADNAEDVQTFVGQVVVSQQLLDRSRNMPDGPGFDVVIYDQLQDDYDQSLNNYAIGKAMSLGPTVAGASTFTNNGLESLYGDLSKAREKLTDAAGVRLQPTHVFTTPDLYSYMSALSDSQHRPMIVPSLAPGVPPGPIGDASDSEAYRWVQFTGTCAPGLLFWFIDATLPAMGSNTPILVSRPGRILLWESEPITRAYVETIADKLQVVVQRYGYAACVPRYPGSTVTINGAAYATSLT